MQNFYTGVVEDIDDPKKMNRVRVRCFGIHTDNLAKIGKDDLPWATVMMPTTAAGVSGINTSPHGLLCGSWVVLFFRDGEAMQDPIIIGSIASISTNAPNTGQGFNDPNGEYPRDDYVGESDVNRLARGDDNENDIPTTKNNSRTQGVVDSKGGEWDEPKTPYAPKYPKNKVYESESGHVKEIDDTEGAERLHDYHKSGTFEEIHPDGTKVVRVVKDNYEIVYGDNFVNVKGSVNLTIDNDCNTYIKGDWNVKVDGDINQTVAGNVKVDVDGNVDEKFGGNQKTEVNGEIDIDGSKVYIN